MRRGWTRQPFRRRPGADAGLTLIELLVALVIFALLGVMAYRAVAAAAASRERIAAELLRWRAIANFFQVAEIDLAQFVQRPVGAQTATSASLALNRAEDGTSEIGFLKLDGSGGAVRRRGYRFDGERIVQLRWPGIDATTAPAAYPILDRVKAMHWTILTADGQRSGTWPPVGVSAAAAPAAIEFELELPDVGTLQRVFVIR